MHHSSGYLFVRTIYECVLCGRHHCCQGLISGHTHFKSFISTLLLQWPKRERESLRLILSPETTLSTWASACMASPSRREPPELSVKSRPSPPRLWRLRESISFFPIGGCFLISFSFIATVMFASTPLWISSCGLRELRMCPPESEFVFLVEETRTRMLRRRWEISVILFSYSNCADEEFICVCSCTHWSPTSRWRISRVFKRRLLRHKLSTKLCW